MSSQPTFARLAANGAAPVQVADAAVATWRDIDAVLSPVVGKRGVAALYARSLHLSRAAHPALADVQQGAAAPGDEFDSLHVALARQTASDAAAASTALIQAFTDLLARLIGVSLTERLLRPVWRQPSSGDAAQDTKQ